MLDEELKKLLQELEEVTHKMRLRGNIDFIVVTITGQEKHTIDAVIYSSDDHHTLDMIHAITNKWSELAHK
jgi:hypothetical protein